MPTRLNTGTGDAPLQFARRFTGIVQSSWDKGELESRATQVTRDLLTWWFREPHTLNRHLNFHTGQWQAILHTLYAHEILGVKDPDELQAATGGKAISTRTPANRHADPQSHPKYCLKMATGTGKTWVMNALLIWQYLNARYETQPCGRFSRHFLLVAPGLIVYERLLDAFLGKEDESGHRDFRKSDFFQSAELFLPPAYRDEVFGFLQANVVEKTDIGRKPTGDGLVAIANWHVLQGEEDEEGQEDVDPLEDPSQATRELFPVTPGTSQGHSLEMLDQNYLRGGQLEYLRDLPHLVVFNDEAHHIHETKKAGIVSEVEWQKSLNVLADGKGERFVQIDFSATPYDVTGSGQNRTKHYFPHIICDFNLRTAIHQGLVKTLTVDRRRELAAEDLEFRSVRGEDGKVAGLSDGQRLMLRAGLTKLRILEREFTALSQNAGGLAPKHPKMLVICEETAVSPFVMDFLRAEGLAEDDLVQVDSDKKGSVPTKEWAKLKQRLFNVDRHPSPKVVVSVLMLREGFDVSNICVVVPLRSSDSPILLEQIIGRGLRLMWREPEFAELKAENRERLLVRKQSPANYLDILSIVEHPAYIRFYQDIDDAHDTITEVDGMPDSREEVLGDILRVDLKPGFEAHDLHWPEILLEKEETLRVMEDSPEYMAPFQPYRLAQLKRMAPPSGETFFSEEVTVRTQFGDYSVSGSVLQSESYNELLGRLVRAAAEQLVRASRRASHFFPTLQINQARLAERLDNFIRSRLFGETFDPLEDGNWRVLLLIRSGITEHLLRELSRCILAAQQQVDVEEAEVRQRAFSELPEMRMRELFSLPVAKCIYPRQPYPSNKGELEREFILALERDVRVEAFIKISEAYHEFVRLHYMRSDGLLARYFPDFLVRTQEHLFLVETKAQSSLQDLNVRQKERSALEWVAKVNGLRASDRSRREWVYVLLGEETFYSSTARGISVPDLLMLARLTRQTVEGTLI